MFEKTPGKPVFANLPLQIKDLCSRFLPLLNSGLPARSGGKGRVDEELIPKRFRVWY